jgi:hypothetical protein
MNTSLPAFRNCPRVSLSSRCRCCWQNLCRLLLTRTWLHGGLVLGALGWWLWQRDAPSTVSAVSVILVLSSWMMNRERIRRALAGRADDDWSTFNRPLLSLDEINHRRQAQERKDRIACRLGLLCTVLAGIVAVVGFRN